MADKLTKDQVRSIVQENGLRATIERGAIRASDIADQELAAAWAAAAACYDARTGQWTTGSFPLLDDLGAMIYG